MKEKIKKWLTPIVFLLLLFGFSAAWLLTPDRAFSESENRFLQTRPSFSWENLLNGTFTTEVDSWITDQFPGRDGFIGVKTQSEYLAGKRDTNGVYFAADGCLIEKHDSINEETFAKNTAHLQAFVNREAERLGSGHVRVLIAPTAGEVWKDKLPPFAVQVPQSGLLEQIQAGIPAESWVSLLEPLSAHADEAVYYKTDHHWTTLGAFYAYRAWCEAEGIPGLTQEDFTVETVSEDFQGTIWSKARLLSTQPDSIQAWKTKLPYSYHLDFNLGETQSDSLYDESYLEKRDKYSYFLGGNNALVKITGGPENGRKLLLVKDSYAHSLAPFLANEFEEIDMVDLRYFNMPLSQYIRENGFTDVMVMYNLVTFTDDYGAAKMDR